MPRSWNFGACCFENVTGDYSAFVVRQTQWLVLDRKYPSLCTDSTKELVQWMAYKFKLQWWKNWHRLLLISMRQTHKRTTKIKMQWFSPSLLWETKRWWCLVSKPWGILSVDLPNATTSIWVLACEFRKRAIKRGGRAFWLLSGVFFLFMICLFPPTIWHIEQS